MTQWHTDKAWCVVCFDRNRDRTGIVNSNTVRQHYQTHHPHHKRKGKLLSYPVKFADDDTPILTDDVPDNLNPSDIEIHGELLLHHKKTEQDIIHRLQHGIEREKNEGSYVIAWFNKPHRSSLDEMDYAWCIDTMWSEEHEDLFTEKIEELLTKTHNKYDDLRQKLEADFPHIMDDVLHRSPANLRKMRFTQKALQLLRELRACQKWTKPFLKPVDEVRDHAPNYYVVIQQPMDLSTLKQKVEQKQVKTESVFCENLMLIWKNAQLYNPPANPVHALSRKCEAESLRLIKKYFAVGNNNSNSNESSVVLLSELRALAEVHYNDENKAIREGLWCTVCQQRMQLFVGFHECNSNGIKYCGCCRRVLRDASVAYYHCLHGCRTHGNRDSKRKRKTKKECMLFLCAICASNKFDCKQITLGNASSSSCIRLPFYGVFVTLLRDEEDQVFYEAIIMQQDLNKIYYRLVFTSDEDVDEHAFEENTATILSAPNGDDRQIRFQFDDQLAELKYGILQQLDVQRCRLRFLTSHEDGKEQSESYEYEKLRAQCDQCKADMLLMMKERIVSDKHADTFCNVHHKYYEQQAKIAGDGERRCLSVRGFEHERSLYHKIHQIAFYYTCMRCDFDVCGACMLIQYELRQQQRHENEINAAAVMVKSPPMKKMRIEDAGHVIDVDIDSEMDSENDGDAEMKREDEQQHQPLRKKKRKRPKAEKENELEEMRGKESKEEKESAVNVADYKALYLREKAKNERLQSTVQQLEAWKARYTQLYAMMQTVLDKDSSS